MVLPFSGKSSNKMMAPKPKRMEFSNTLFSLLLNSSSTVLSKNSKSKAFVNSAVSLSTRIELRLAYSYLKFVLDV